MNEIELQNKFQEIRDSEIKSYKEHVNKVVPQLLRGGLLLGSELFGYLESLEAKHKSTLMYIDKALSITELMKKKKVLEIYGQFDQ